MADDIQSLNAEIDGLSQPDRLLMAAMLLERGHVQMAHAIAKRVATELGAALCLQAGKK
jgi:hypothetical protein